MDFPYDRTLASAIRPRDNSSYRAVNPRRANVQGGRAGVHCVNEDAAMETCGEGMWPATVRVSVVIRETAR